MGGMFLALYGVVFIKSVRVEAWITFLLAAEMLKQARKMHCASRSAGKSLNIHLDRIAKG